MGVPSIFLHFIFILNKVIDTLSFQSLTTLPNHVTLYCSATYHIVPFLFYTFTSFVSTTIWIRTKHLHTNIFLNDWITLTPFLGLSQCGKMFLLPFTSSFPKIRLPLFIKTKHVTRKNHVYEKNTNGNPSLRSIRKIKTQKHTCHERT